MTTLLLVRHGPTRWTHEHRLQGRTDIDLSAQGRAAVQALHPVVAAWSPVRVVSSPLGRALSTARILSAGADLQTDERWAEAGLGEWEGRTPEQIGPAYRRWRAGALVPPGGEPTEAVTARVEAAVLAAAAGSGPVLVATHGGTIRCVLDRFVGLRTERMVPVLAPSLTVLEVEPDGSARLRQLNAGCSAGSGQPGPAGLHGERGPGADR